MNKKRGVQMQLYMETDIFLMILDINFLFETRWGRAAFE